MAVDITISAAATTAFILSSYFHENDERYGIMAVYSLRYSASVIEANIVIFDELMTEYRFD